MELLRDKDLKAADLDESFQGLTSKHQRNEEILKQLREDLAEKARSQRKLPSSYSSAYIICVLVCGNQLPGSTAKAASGVDDW